MNRFKPGTICNVKGTGQEVMIFAKQSESPVFLMEGGDLNLEAVYAMDMTTNQISIYLLHDLILTSGGHQS